MSSFVSPRGGKSAAPKLPPPDPTEDRYNASLRNFFDLGDERIVQRNNALKFAYGALVVAAICMIAVIMTLSQPKLIPYLVEVQTNTRVVNGVSERHTEAVSLARPADQDKEILDRAVQFEVKEFIEAARSVTYDTEFERTLLLHWVQPFLVPESQAANMVNQFLKDNDPYQRAKTGLVEVAVDEPVPQPGDTTYQVHWFEIARTPHGDEIGRTEWSGFVTVELHQVDTSAMLDNPLGIYIRDLTWQQVGLTNSTPGGRK